METARADHSCKTLALKGREKVVARRLEGARE